MTIHEIKKKALELGVNYAYGSFNSNDNVNLPFLTGRIDNDSNFSADNKVYYKNHNFILELTTQKKDISLEQKIEEKIIHDIYYEKSESDNPDENIYTVMYSFEIEEG
nr:MAG TPA: hypothetical protein [Caudoviricetes sp.]